MRLLNHCGTEDSTNISCHGARDVGHLFLTVLADISCFFPVTGRLIRFQNPLDLAGLDPRSSSEVGTLILANGYLAHARNCEERYCEGARIDARRRGSRLPVSLTLSVVTAPLPLNSGWFWIFQVTSVAMPY